MSHKPEKPDEPDMAYTRSAASIPYHTFTVPNTAISNLAIKISEPDLRADSLTLTTWTSAFVLTRRLFRLSLPGLKARSKPIEAVDHIHRNGSENTVNGEAGVLRADSTTTTTTKTTSITNKQHDKSTDENRDKVPIAVIPLLELGAGTALAGLSAAAIFSTHAVLTDLPSLIPGLRHNTTLNAPLLREHSATIACGALDWRHPEILTLDQPDTTGAKSYHSTTTKALTILAADTVYDAQHPELLSRAIAAWLSPSGDARVVLTVALRVAYLEYISELWGLMERLGLEVEASGQERAEEGVWEDDDERLCEWSVWRWRESEHGREGAVKLES